MSSQIEIHLRNNTISIAKTGMDGKRWRVQWFERPGYGGNSRSDITHVIWYGPERHDVIYASGARREYADRARRREKGRI